MDERKLDPMDLERCVRRLPSCVKKLLNENPGAVGVAGGFIRSVIAGEPVNDVDLFAKNKALAETLAQKLASEPGRRLVATDNAYTVVGIHPPVQFIHRWVYEDISLVVQSFDFTVCAAALWKTDAGWESCCDVRFYRDLAAKRLVYRSPVREEAPGGSLLRVLKYGPRGYRAPLSSLAKVLERLLTGVDVQRAERVGIGAVEVILGLLKDVDPAAIDIEEHASPRNPRENQNVPS